MIYPGKLSFEYEGEIKDFTENESWGNLPPQNLHYKKCWKELFYPKQKDKSI